MIGHGHRHQGGAWISVGWLAYRELYRWIPTDSGWRSGLLAEYRSGSKDHARFPSCAQLDGVPS